MSIITDFADIRSRMLGDDKPAPKVLQVEKPACNFCGGNGWFLVVKPPIKCGFCNLEGIRPCP